MSLKNRYNLWKLKQDFAPGKVFKAGLERSLSRAWNAKYGRPNWFQIGLLHKGAAFAVVVLLLIGSTGAYAYVSPEVTEGSALYPVKQAVERAEAVIKITPEAKAKFYLKQISRREAERDRLKAREVKTVAPAAKILEMASATATARLEIVKEKIKQKRIEKTEELLDRAEENLEKTEKIMDKFNARNVQLREKVKERLQIRVEKQKERLDKLENLKEKKGRK